MGDPRHDEFVLLQVKSRPAPYSPNGVSVDTHRCLVEEDRPVWKQPELNV